MTFNHRMMDAARVLPFYRKLHKPGVQESRLLREGFLQLRVGFNDTDLGVYLLVFGEAALELRFYN